MYFWQKSYMKNILFCSLIVGLLYSCSEKGKIETDYKVYEVHGNVRQIAYSGAQPNEKDVTVTFNRDGMLELEKIRGRSFEYKYDGTHVVSLKSYIGDSVDLRRTFEYKNGLPVEIKEYDGTGTFRKKVQYEYNSDGNRVKGVILNPYNDTMFVWKYTYKDSLVMQETRINYQGTTKFVQTFDYSYNEKGELLSIVESSDGEIYSKTEYKTFHTVPLQTTVINYWNNQPSDSTTMMYVFDEKGNWIFKRTKSSGGREQRQERTIMYYK